MKQYIICLILVLYFTETIGQPPFLSWFQQLVSSSGSTSGGNPPEGGAQTPAPESSQPAPGDASSGAPTDANPRGANPFVCKIPAGPVKPICADPKDCIPQTMQSGIHCDTSDPTKVCCLPSGNPLVIPGPGTDNMG